jgi:2-polyprenyl-3-methyl-5-hydroxy-6-metoxy-1,4-benzoquinol methylase
MMIDKEQFWNNRFIDKKIIWGLEPSNIAIDCEKIFAENNVKNILIMGAGYGRNGKYFTEKGYCVDGMEISEEAIIIGKTFAPEMRFIKGDIVHTELSKKYDAVFCYDIIQLFLRHERETIAENCIKHCKDGGMIVISCLAKTDILFGLGKEFEKDTFEVTEGLTIHFSDEPEMNNLNQKLETIQLEYDTEREKGGTEKERNRIYGIYRACCKTEVLQQPLRETH